MKIRVPADLREFIIGEATENSSSQNSEIIRAIRAAMKAKGAAEAATSPRHGSSNPDQEKADEHARF